MNQQQEEPGRQQPLVPPTPTGAMQSPHAPILVAVIIAIACHAIVSAVFLVQVMRTIFDISSPMLERLVPFQYAGNIQERWLFLWYPLLACILHIFGAFILFGRYWRARRDSLYVAILGVLLALGNEFVNAHEYLRMKDACSDDLIPSFTLLASYCVVCLIIIIFLTRPAVKAAFTQEPWR